MSKKHTTLGELLDEGVQLCPVFNTPLGDHFRVGFYYNGIPHAIGKKRFRTHSEAQEEIQKLMQTYKIKKQLEETIKES
jgi:hypothetical protein